LPACGQAPALLADRKKEAQTQIQRYKKNFGNVGVRKSPILTEEEFEHRRQIQIKALTGMNTAPLANNAVTVVIEANKR